MVVNIPDYWDYATGAWRYTARWYSSQDGSLSFYNDNYWVPDFGGCTKEETYDATGAWTDAWYYRVDGLGLHEPADMAPSYGWQKTLGQQRRTIVYSQPIRWGGKLPLGIETAFPCQIKPDVFRWPPYSTHPDDYGMNYITPVALHPTWTDGRGRVHSDVLELIYTQQWGSNLPVGARYWLVKGIGRKGVNWLTLDAKRKIIDEDWLETAVYTHSKILSA